MSSINTLSNTDENPLNSVFARKRLPVASGDDRCACVCAQMQTTFKSKKSLEESVGSDISPLLFPYLPFPRTATENVYTLLQPPRSAVRVGSPNDGGDGKLCDGKGGHALSPAPAPGVPHPCVGGSKHPFYSPREVQLVQWGRGGRRDLRSVWPHSLASACILTEIRNGRRV